MPLTPRARVALRILLAGYLGWVALTWAFARSWRWWVASAGLLAFVHAVVWFLELKETPRAEGD